MSGHKQQRAKSRKISHVYSDSPPVLQSGAVESLNNESQIAKSVLLKTLMELKLFSELDYISLKIDEDPTHAQLALSSLKNSARLNIRNLMSARLSLVTDTPLRGTCSISPGKRYCFDIAGETSDQVNAENRYVVYGQGMMLGDTLIEKAIVARIPGGQNEQS